MPDETRLSLQEILLGASERSGDDRRAFIARACGGDAALEAEVESLLAHDTRTPSILGEGAIGRMVEQVFQAPQKDRIGIGSTVGPYTLAEVIGEGGMGVVFRARQTEPLVRDVALKLVRRGVDTDRVVSRFEAERQVLARMDHPGIARVYDAGATTDGRPFFAMELVAGQPITVYADEARLTVRDRVQLLRQACLAVQHAHQKGVIHRDLKPSNILATARDGGHDVKVIDFGIAKATVSDDNETLLTREGQFVGTPSYMSPEQAGALAADVDTRTDVYALGVVLYELLAGRRPYEFAKVTPAEIQRVFEATASARPSTAVTGAQRLGWSTGSAASDQLAAIADRRGSTPARLKRDLAGDLDNIVLKAIERSPERRYASMEQFADDLARFLDGRPVLARPATLTYRAQKFAQRHTLGVVVGAMVAVFLVAFVTMTIVQSQRLARERDRAIAAEQRARLEAETASRTADFLSGVFSVNDPSESRGRSVTALELLDRSAKEIGEGLADQPALQSRLMVTMGNVYKQLGLFSQATGLLEQAVTVRERAGDSAPLDLSYALDALGDARRMKGALNDAAVVLQRAVDINRQHPDVSRRSAASALNNLGLVRQGLGEFDAAEPLLREALELRRQRFATAEPGERADAADQLAGSLNNLGQFLGARSRYKEAEASLRESLGIRERAQPPRVVQLANTRLALAVNLMRQDKLADAEPMMRQVVADRTEVLGATHPQTIDARSELANLLHDQGNYDEAEVNYRAVVDGRRERGGNDYAVALNNLASLLEDRGDFADARPLFEESLALRRSVNSQNHPSVATAVNNLARLHYDLGNYERARELVVNALAIRRERFGDAHVATATTRLLFGRVTDALGDRAGALREAQAALEGLRKVLDADHASIANAEIVVGRMLVDAGRADEGLPLLEHAVRVRSSRPLPPTTAWRLAEAQLTLGRALVAVGRAAEGRSLIRAAAPLVLKSPSPHPTIKTEARRALGR